MYIVRNKESKNVIYINHSNKELEGKEIYRKFDQHTMEIGKTNKTHIPANFNINDDGEVAELALEEKIKAGLPVIGIHQKFINGQLIDKNTKELIDEEILSFDYIKSNMTQAYATLSFMKRRNLIPDYQLENAALGVYDDQRKTDCLSTVKAFRDEFHRLRDLIENSTTIEELEKVEEQFPTDIIKA